MTISSQVGRKSYAGDGVSLNFATEFKFFALTDVTVIRQSATGIDTELTPNVDFTVSGAGSESGGTVAVAVAPAIGETLTILLDPELTQQTDYVSNDAFPAESHERALDRQVQMEIRTRDMVSRAVRLPDGDAVGIAQLPGVAARAGKVLAFDAGGAPVAQTVQGTVVIAGSIGTPELANDGATNAKLSNMVSGTFKARRSTGTGDPEDITYLQGRGLMRLPDRALGVPVYGSAPYDAFGDSYTTGTGATANTCFAANIAARMNGTFNNRGISGTGVTKALVQAFTFLPKYRMRGRLITWMAGFNDLHFNGGGANTLQKIRDCTRAFIANAFLKRAVPASDASVTRTGVWTNATPGTWGDKASINLAGNALFSSVSTNKLSFAFTGESVVIGTWNGNGSTYTQGQIDIYIDGIFVETLTPQSGTDGNTGLPDTYEGLTHTALVYTGLGQGAHTIEVRLKVNQITMVDYFGTLAPPGECPSLLMGEVSYVDAIGYATVETLRSRAIDDTASAAIRDTIDAFAVLGYPVAVVPVNDYYDADTMIHTDHDHPAPAGHVAIAKAFSSRAFVAPVIAPPACSLTKAATQAVTTAVATAITFSAASDDTQGFFAVANPSRIVAPANGRMQFSGTVVWAQNNAGSRVLELHKNGGGVLRTMKLDTFGAIASPGAQSFCLSEPCVAGDYFEIFGTQTSGGNLNVATETVVDITMVR